MKRIVSLFLILSLCFPPSEVFAAGVVWVHSYGGTIDDTGRAVAVDAAGNIVVTGFFSGSVNFGGTALANLGGGDIFLAKYSSSGAPLWSIGLGGPLNEMGLCLATDVKGNIAVGGVFTGTIDLGGGPLTSAGQNDLFVAVYSPSGSHMWSKRFGGTGNLDSLNALAFDGYGNLILTGDYQGTTNFGGGNVMSAFNGPDSFLVKYSPTGRFLWAKTFVSTSDDNALVVTVDPRDNNLLISGNFVGSLDLGNSPLTAQGGDIFMAKFSSSGSLLWSKRLGGPNGDNLTSMALDRNGDVVITGNFSYSTNLDGNTLTASGVRDLFLAKYSGSGTHLWSERLGGTGDEFPQSVALDKNGNILIAGYFFGTWNFGGTDFISPGAAYDMFLAKFSPLGNPLWLEQIGGSSDDKSYGVAMNGQGEAIMTGAFRNQLSLNGQTFTSAGSTDVLLLKHAP